MVLGRSLKRLQEGSGKYPYPEAQQIDARTSVLYLATWPNNPNAEHTSYVDDAVVSMPAVAATVTFWVKSFHLIERILR